ncbi:hypothetical protein J6590_065572 [Homalodisca vitripennis]|nr:hypothetical protein J6590_065572 [Homalodisca vitripennis]
MKKSLLKKIQPKKKLKYDDSSSESEGSLVLIGSDDSMTIDEFVDDSHCAECLEKYEETKSTADWIKCVKCSRWLHETCSIYSFNGKCGDCGRRERSTERERADCPFHYSSTQAICSWQEGPLHPHSFSPPGLIAPFFYCMRSSSLATAYS